METKRQYAASSYGVRYSLSDERDGLINDSVPKVNWRLLNTPRVLERSSRAACFRKV